VSCDQSSLVQRYYDGELPAEQMAVVEAHLRLCAECRELMVELTRISELIASVTPAQIPAEVRQRLHEALEDVGQRAVLRIAGWLTAAAAAVLLGALPFWPTEQTEAGLRDSSWQTVALMPPTQSHEEMHAELVVLAQQMADDFSPDQMREKR
jgi:predicted anti-sigma-YlaC factor YlaD